MASTSFSLTINTIASGPFSLYSILSSGTAPTGCTLGVGSSITPVTAKPVAYLSIQNTSANIVYIGDSTLTVATNVGIQIPANGVLQVSPGTGSAWINTIYFNASVNTTTINFTVIYK